MTTEELIRKAVERLNKVKQLKLNIDDIIEQLGKDNVFAVLITDNENGCSFDTVIDEDLSTQQLLPDDPTNLSPDDIIMLRIAKHIFETYKKFKANLIDDSLILNANQTISSIQWGNTTYDIGVNGRSLTATFDEVDELKDKVKDLEERNAQLEQELNSIKAMKDIIWQTLQDKGMI